MRRTRITTWLSGIFLIFGLNWTNQIWIKPKSALVQVQQPKNHKVPAKIALTGGLALVGLALWRKFKTLSPKTKMAVCVGLGLVGSYLLWKAGALTLALCSVQYILESISDLYHNLFKLF